MPSVDKLDVVLTAESGVSNVYHTAVQGGQPPYAYTWSYGGVTTSGTSDTYTIDHPTAGATTVAVTVHDSADPPSSGSAEFSIANAVDEIAPATPTQPAQTVWSTPLAWWSAAFLSVLYLATLCLLWLGMHDRLGVGAGAPQFAAAVSAALIALAVLAMLGGVFLGLLEFRGKATVVDNLPATPRTTVDSDGQLGDSILQSVDLAKVLEQFRQMSNQIALLFVASLCVLGAIIIVSRAEGATPATPGPSASPSSAAPTPT